MTIKKAILIPAILAAQAAFAGEKTVTDDLGRSVSFTDPATRIVVMHEPVLGLPLMDMGLVPVASYGRSEDGHSLTTVDFVETVLGGNAAHPATGIGAIGNIDLEKLKALDPDLIIGTEHDAAREEQLASVAPLYLQSVDPAKSYGFGIEEKLSKVLGLEEAFAAREAAYNQQLETVASKLGNPDGKSYLAIFLTDQINLVGNFSGMVQALEDLGYQRDTISEVGAISGQGKMLFVPISPEIFARVNPDLLLIMRSYTESDRGEGAIRSQLDKLVPGWDKFMQPVKDGRVVFLDSAKVTTPTVASAMNTLDALSDWSTK